MDEGLKCFDTAKNEAQNASHTAQMAFNISEEAKEVSCLLDLYSMCQTFMIAISTCSHINGSNIWLM